MSGLPKRPSGQAQLTPEQRAALEVVVRRILMPLIEKVLVEKLDQIAAFMIEELNKGATNEQA